LEFFLINPNNSLVFYKNLIILFVYRHNTRKNTYCSGVYSEKHTKCSSISDASKTEYISLHHYMTPKTAFFIADREDYPLLGNILNHLKNTHLNIL